MKKLSDIVSRILCESSFSNWKKPSKSELELEYRVEYQNHIKYSYGNIWPTVADFLKSVKSARVVTVSSGMDNKINNRSQIGNMRDLLSLIKTYRSYPKYRNEDSLQAIDDGFKNNKAMTMPLVLDDNGHLHIMAGNTRMDIAFMNGVKPKVLMIKVPEGEKS